MILIFLPNYTQTYYFQALLNKGLGEGEAVLLRSCIDDSILTAHCLVHVTYNSQQYSDFFFEKYVHLHIKKKKEKHVHKYPPILSIYCFWVSVGFKI